jgi:hypothetical protein
MRKLIIAAAMTLGSLSAVPVMATEAVPRALAEHLDQAPSEFTWSAAAERRHEMMRQTQRQQRYGRGGYDRGYDRGYGRGYGRNYDYGPGPGYRRPPPPPYYGPRW